MSVKINNVMRHLEAHGKVILKMDKASGFYQLTISKRADHYVVGFQPGGKIAKANAADLKAMLIENSIYIESWR